MPEIRGGTAKTKAQTRTDREANRKKIYKERKYHGEADMATGEQEKKNRRRRGHVTLKIKKKVQLIEENFDVNFLENFKFF